MQNGRRSVQFKRQDNSFKLRVTARETKNEWLFWKDSRISQRTKRNQKDLRVGPKAKSWNLFLELKILEALILAITKRYRNIKIK